MTLSFRNLALGLLVLFGLTWWMLRADPETEVRNAHAELRTLLSKTDDEAAPALLLKTRALADLFAAPVEISGAAEGLAGVYSPEDLGSMIVRLRVLFSTIDLTFDELAIEFPTADDAVIEFSAVLVAEPQNTAAGEYVERRSVTSRMRQDGGAWLFTEIALAESGED